MLPRIAQGHVQGCLLSVQVHIRYMWFIVSAMNGWVKMVEEA